jgi:hypothetical protein
MIYKITKTISDLEFETLYYNDSVNIESELQLEFELDYPNHSVVHKLGYIINNDNGTKTYDLTIIYELTRLIK